MYILELESGQKAIVHIKECLKMALNVNTENLLFVTEGAEFNYNYLKQLIYLHSINEIHAANRESGGLHSSMTDLIFGAGGNYKSNGRLKLVNPSSIVWSQGPSSNQAE